MDPFQPLMSEGGRPPPNQAPSHEQAHPQEHAPTSEHAPSVRVQVDAECKCAPLKCPENGDEVRSTP